MDFDPLADLDLTQIPVMEAKQTPQAAAHQRIKEQLAPELAGKVVYDGNPNVAGGVQKVSYTHEDMIDFILANPRVTNAEIAVRYGYTQSWVSRILSSDAFRAMYARRRDEVVDPTILHEVEERFRALTMRSLDIVMEKLDCNPTMDMALKALDLSSRAQGYGVAKGAQVQVTNSFVVALPPKAADAKSWIENHGPARVLEVLPGSHSEPVPPEPAK